MNDFYTSKAGVVLRYVLFVPIGLLVATVVSLVISFFFSWADNWFGNLIVPQIIGTCAGGFASIYVYPRVNKRPVTIAFFAIYGAFLLIMAMVVAVGWSKGAEVKTIFSLWMRSIPAFIGLYLVDKFVRKDTTKTISSM